MLKRLMTIALIALLPIGSMADQATGPVTGLPMPRFVSMKATEGYARRGPSQSHRIDWVFKHQGLPLMVTAEYEHWRKVQDSEGQGGWMHFRLLSGTRSVTISAEETLMYRRANASSSVAAKLEQGVIGKLLECDASFCRLQVDRQRGWVDRKDLWGIFVDEIID